MEGEIRMIQSAKNNARNETKAPEKAKTSEKAKGGMVNRLPVKKIYCNRCHKLIKGQMQITGNITRIICPKCNQSLWTWNSLFWKSAKSGSVAAP
jgi:RNase P subunit RPR2